MTRLFLVLFALLLAGCASVPGAPKPDLRAQVEAAERAFAATMARRDLAGFSSFLSEDTVFFSPKPTHGKQAVTEAWSRFYTRPEAPFSWEPKEVEVHASGTLALSAGPVRDPAGKLIGRYMSIWRLEAPGVWRVLFDYGCSCPLRE